MSPKIIFYKSESHKVLYKYYQTDIRSIDLLYKYISFIKLDNSIKRNKQ